jgi:hypothetical protein
MKQLPVALCHLFSDCPSPSIAHVMQNNNGLTRGGEYQPFLKFNSEPEKRDLVERFKGITERTCHLYYPIWDDFAGSTMLAFWEHPGLLQYEPATEYVNRYIKGNIYLHPDGERALIVVSNLGAQDETVRLKLHLDKYGFTAGNTAVRDLYTRQVFDFGEIRLPCYAEETRFILLKDRGNTHGVRESRPK